MSAGRRALGFLALRCLERVARPGNLGAQAGVKPSNRIFLVAPTGQERTRGQAGLFYSCTAGGFLFSRGTDLRRDNSDGGITPVGGP